MHQSNNIYKNNLLLYLYINFFIYILNVASKTITFHSNGKNVIQILIYNNILFYKIIIFSKKNCKHD